VRAAIRVHPRARHTRVGGDHDGALIVRVPEPAVDGKATAAALTALANALGLHPREIALVTGATNRTKIVDIPDFAAAQFAMLRRT
jgi:uncharacterized protein